MQWFNTAGDTFRAAATEQLQIWGERNDISVVAQGHGADSASVIFDAFESARASIKLLLLCKRPAVSAINTSIPLARALSKASKITEALSKS
jgi:signal recognition particle GTPase